MRDWLFVALGLLGGCSSGPAQPDFSVAKPAAAPPSAAVAASAEPRTVDIQCPAPDRPLAATLWLPATGAGPFPVAVVLVGGQMWDRNGDLPDAAWHHYADFADAIARRGGAALLFDKGGTGATGGPAPDDAQRLREAAAALECARARREVDAAHVTLLGHSDGSVLATEAELTGAEVQGLVLLSPGADAERLAALPKGLPVLLVWAEHDFGAEDNAVRLRALGDRARSVTVPGSDHLLFDNTKGEPDPKAPSTRVAAVATEAVAKAVVGQ